jgi:hypothetical protein
MDSYVKSLSNHLHTTSLKPFENSTHGSNAGRTKYPEAQLPYPVFLYFLYF